MQKMTVNEAAKAMNGTASGDGVFSSVCIDSRAIEDGCLFFAIKGDNFDGHAFVRAALSSGAAAAVCSSPVDGAGGPVIMVEDTRKALMALAAYYRSKFSIPVVGLTGSVGKTTTKDMVAAVLSTRFRTLATEGNFNNEIGLPRMCFKLDDSIQAAVLEMGMSDFGEISRLTQVARPTVGLITNIGVSHIEKLLSREGILKAKMEILDGMDKDSKLILNGDDDMLSTVVPAHIGRVITYGVDNENVDCRAVDIEQGEDSIRFKLCYKGRTYPVELPVIGRHNVYNACAAFLCGSVLGISPADAVDGLKNYSPDQRRQKIVHKKEITFIEDCYNASPDSVRAALAVLAALPCEGKRIAVLGDMLELGDYARTAHSQCGAAVAEYGIDTLLAYGKNALYYIEGAGEKVHSRLYSEKDQLAQELAELLEPGDAVLFKASRGMKLEECIEALYSRLDKE